MMSGKRPWRVLAVCVIAYGISGLSAAALAETPATPATPEVIEGPRPVEVAPAAQDAASDDCPQEAMTFSHDVTLSPEGELSATVLHSGGCGAHTYCVGYRYTAATDAAQVWVGHIHDGTDRCKEMVEGVAVRALPPEVLKAQTLTLLTPGKEVALPR